MKGRIEAAMKVGGSWMWSREMGEFKWMWIDHYGTYRDMTESMTAQANRDLDCIMKMQQRIAELEKENFHLQSLLWPDGEPRDERQKVL